MKLASSNWTFFFFLTKKTPFQTHMCEICFNWFYPFVVLTVVSYFVLQSPVMFVLEKCSLNELVYNQSLRRLSLWGKQHLLKTVFETAYVSKPINHTAYIGGMIYLLCMQICKMTEYCKHMKSSAALQSSPSKQITCVNTDLKHFRCKGKETLFSCLLKASLPKFHWATL